MKPRIYLKYFFLFSLLLFNYERAFSSSSIDFSSYRIGYNNRPLFEAIIKELISEFGTQVRTSYRQGNQAQADLITIDEDAMDKYLKETDNPKERESIARFILAHEYFHVFLKHTQVRNSITTPKEIKITGTFSEARKQMEHQVDHLAAKHVHSLGLPLEPLRKMFEKHPELEGGGEYPSAQERIQTVWRATQPGLEESFFDNAAIKCSRLLEKLRGKFLD